MKGTCLTFNIKNHMSCTSTQWIIIVSPITLHHLSIDMLSVHWWYAKKWTHAIKYYYYMVLYGMLQKLLKSELLVHVVSELGSSFKNRDKTDR